MSVRSLLHSYNFRINPRYFDGLLVTSAAFTCVTIFFNYGIYFFIPHHNSALNNDISKYTLLHTKLLSYREKLK